MSFFICDKYKAKFDSIFQQIGEATNDSLSFSSRVRGVEIAVIFEIIGERVKGILTVGKSEQNGFLKNQISFALNKKSHKADFNRLGFHLVATAIGHIKVNQGLSD